MEVTLATTSDPIVISQYEVLLGDIKEAEDAEQDRPCFDYESKDGNKAARSHVYQLRKLRARVESARKEAKSYALAYGKRVDEQANELFSKIDGLILPVQSGIDEVAQREAARIAQHQMVLDRVNDLAVVPLGTSSEEIKRWLDHLDGINLDELEEFADRVTASIVVTRRTLLTALEQTTALEQQKRELERLQAEAQEREAREKKEREAAEIERIRQEERDKADEVAQQAADAAIAEAEHRAAMAEAKLASVVSPAATTEPQQALAPAVYPPADDHEDLEAALAQELTQAIAPLSKREVIHGIIHGTLHPAVVVIWSNVEVGA